MGTLGCTFVAVVAVVAVVGIGFSVFLNNLGGVIEDLKVGGTFSACVVGMKF